MPAPVTDPIKGSPVTLWDNIQLWVKGATPPPPKWEGKDAFTPPTD